MVITPQKNVLIIYKNITSSLLFLTNDNNPGSTICCNENAAELGLHASQVKYKSAVRILLNINCTRVALLLQNVSAPILFECNKFILLRSLLQDLRSTWDAYRYKFKHHIGVLSGNINNGFDIQDCCNFRAKKFFTMEF